MKLKNNVWHHVTILFTFLLPAYADSEGVVDDCKCTMYDYDYMYCNCCPAQATPGYAYRIDYTFKKFGVEQSGRCDEDRATDPARMCDCVFCGIIRNVSNPFYKVCKDTATKDFLRSLTYQLNVTYADAHNIWSYTQAVTADDSIMLPSPPTIDNWYSFLDDGIVGLELRWTQLPVHYNDLNYTIKWHVFGDGSDKMVAHTDDKFINLTGLLPNTQYAVSITCRHPESQYDSRPVEMVDVTAEKQPEYSPPLLNYQINSNDCDDQDNCNITLFWKPLSLEEQSANCTGYQIKTFGDDLLLDQFVDCDVMAVIGVPLSRHRDYTIELLFLSKVGVSPPSTLEVPAMEKVESFEVPLAIIERNSKHVTVDVKWQHQAAPPTHYELLYCRGTSTEKCQEKMMQDTLIANANGNATLRIVNQGSDFLYNIAPYWGNVTAGLGEVWLCVFDTCGNLVKPEFSLTGEQEQESLSFTISEAGCSPVENDRGRPYIYEIEVSDQSNEVETYQVNVFGPVPFKLEGLRANQFYDVRVRSQGSCGCDSPKCKYSAWTAHSFKTLEKEKQVFPPWAIAVVVISGFLVVIVIVLVGLWHCHRRNKEFKESLEEENFKAPSDISTYENTLTWLEKSEFGDYAQIDFPNQSVSADSDSGIEDADMDEHGGCICPCKKKKKKKGIHPTKEKMSSEIPTIAVIKTSFPSLPSHDSGHSGDSSVPGSPTEENMLEATAFPVEDRDVARDNRLSGSSPRDGNQPESEITSYPCQASPISSMNGLLASHSAERDAVTPLEDHNSAKAKSNANPDEAGNKYESAAQMFDGASPPLALRAFVPGIDENSYTGTSDEGENSDPSLMQVKSNPNYIQIHCQAHPLDSLSFSSDGFAGKEETSECSKESSGDESDSEGVKVANLSGLLKSGNAVLENKNHAVLPCKSETLKHPMTVAPYEKLDYMPNSQDGPEAKSDGNYGMKSPNEIRPDISNLAGESSTSSENVSGTAKDVRCDLLNRPNSDACSYDYSRSGSQSLESDDEDENDSMPKPVEPVVALPKVNRSVSKV